MGRNQFSKKRTLTQVAQKYFVSAFVAVSFVAYALHERRADAVLPARANSAEPVKPVATLYPPLPTVVPIVIVPTPTVAIIAAAPTAAPIRPNPTNPAPKPAATQVPSTPTPVPSKNGVYKDGQFTGKVADAYFGPVQVSVLIKNGKIADVQFLDYPRSRRTSVRINERANPQLQSEAIQIQSARVNIISGATLTSRAFAESLQTALDGAKN